MPVIKLTLPQFAREVGQLPSELDGDIVRGLRSAAARGVGEVVRAIQTSQPRPAVDTGQLARSVSDMYLPKGAAIVVDAPYAAVMETGARPFWPPLQPLIDWASRKFGLTDEEAESMARAVQRAIAQRGIAPRHYMRTAMARIRKIVPIEVESQIAKRG